VDIYGALPHEPTPYVYVYSLQTELEPFRNWQVNIGYQGSRSRKLVRTIDMNRFRPGDTWPDINGLNGGLDGIQNNTADGVPCGPTNAACPAPVAVGNNRFARSSFPLPDVNASFDAMVAHSP